MLIFKFQGPKLKRAWQAQFLSHTLVILEYEGFFIDVEMILVTFFYISIVWIELSCGQAVKKFQNSKGRGKFKFHATPM